MPFLYGTNNSITEYRSACQVDKMIMEQNGIKTQEEYRMFIQQNGQKMLDAERASVQRRVTEKTP